MTSSEKKSRLPIPLPPPEQPTDPDKYTAKSPDMTGDSAEGRVFLFKAWGVRYGTDDKGHAAAIILAVLLLFLLFSLFLIGAVSGALWVSDALKLLVPAFTLVAGVAIGKSGSKSNS